MTRHFLPILKARHRRRRAASRSTTRHLRLEHLDRRIVLSGLPEAAAVLVPPSEPAVEDSTVLADTQAAQLDATTVAPVYLAEDGVLHVHPTAADANVVVRQFIDYQLQEVVEVEVAGQWTAVPAQQVQELRVHLVHADQTVEVTDGVTVSAQLIEPEAVDVLLASDDPELLVALPILDPIDSTTNTGPEGEEQESQDPPGPPNLQPEITSLQGSNQDEFWQFTGTVTDDDSLSGLDVKFGGILDGYSAPIQSDGTFSITVLLPPGTTGYVTATVTDSDGWESEVFYLKLE